MPWGKSTPAPKLAPAAPAAPAAAGASSDDEGDDDDEACRQRGRPDGRTWLDDEALHVGAEVQIHSLTGATEHNGSRGELLRFDSEKGRWDVRIGIGQKGRVLALKPDNMHRVMARESRAAEGTTSLGAPGSDHRLEVGVLVKVHSLTGAVEHNGAHGTLVRLDECTGRWEVKKVVRGGGEEQTLALKPANLTFMASAADMAKLDAWRNERQVPKAQGHWGIPKGTG
jgi:hypothetical protein